MGDCRAAAGVLVRWAGVRALGWYDTQSVTLPALLGQDAITLIFGLPGLIVSAWLAHRGSTRALLCWMGSLFYVAYFYYFYVVGIRFNPLFPAYIALVSMSVYGLLELLFALDLRALETRVDKRMPVRLIGSFLIGISLVFLAMWLGVIVSNLVAGTELDPVSRLVIAIDGVILLPLAFHGGLWIWRRQPHGYAVAGLVLAKSVATFLTLVATTLVAIRWGQMPDALQTAVYLVAVACSSALLVSYLRCIEEGPHVSSSAHRLVRPTHRGDREWPGP